MNLKSASLAAGLAIFASVVATPALSSDDAAAIIEAARERARKIDELKSVLNDPDPTLRLAAFDAMLTSKDSLMRDLAIQTGLDSTDSVMRGMALRHTIVGRDRIEFSLQPDPATPAPIQKAAQDFIDTTGQSGFSLPLERDKADANDGRLKPSGCGGDGKVSGLLVTFRCGAWLGEVELQDDNTLKGSLRYEGGQPNPAFLATAKIL